MPLREALLALRGKANARHHPLGRYATAFENSHFLVGGLVAVGGDSIVFRLANADILHITAKILTQELGNRFFDLPIRERGAIDSAGGMKVHYFLQPEAQTPVSERAMYEFQRRIEAHGWVFADRSQRQLGVFEGETKLLDPFAVERMPFFRAK